MTVTRAFPIGAVLKEKKVNGEIVINSHQICDSVLQIRSSTMQVC